MFFLQSEIRRCLRTFDLQMLLAKWFGFRAAQTLTSVHVLWAVRIKRLVSLRKKIPDNLPTFLTDLLVSYQYVTHYEVKSQVVVVVVVVVFYFFSEETSL